MTEIRTFDTGATRNLDVTRDDPEGFLSPIVIDRYSKYMSKNRLQADGSVRDSDNWQKGIPLSAYMKGMWRHFLHLWTRHRGWKVTDPGAAADIEEDLCAIIFNTQGYLFEILREKYAAICKKPAPVGVPGDYSWLQCESQWPDSKHEAHVWTLDGTEYYCSPESPGSREYPWLKCNQWLMRSYEHGEHVWEYEGTLYYCS